MINSLDRRKMLLSLDVPVYLNKDYINDFFNKTDCVKINANIKDEELYSIDFYEVLNKKKYLIINMDASSDNQQKRFLSIIKDKRFRLLTLDKDLKIIVSSSDFSIISDEVKSLILI